MKYIKCYLSTLLLFTISLALAQRDLGRESVEVIRSFEATLLESEKIDIAPQLPPIDTTSKRQQYNVPIQTMNVNYPPPRIRPLAFESDRLPDSYNGYIKGGGGFPNSFYGKGTYHIFTQEKLDIGIDLNHHTANNSARIENQRFSKTSIMAQGTNYSESGLALRGKVGYTSDNVYFYGYNAERENLVGGDTLSIPKEEVQQTFSIFDLGVQVFNGVRTAGDVNYSAGFDLYAMGDITPSAETGFDLKLAGEKWFANKHALRVLLRTDFTRYSTTSDSVQRLNNFFLQPNFTFTSSAFKFKVGVNIATNNDKFSFFPDLELSANAIENLLTIFAGAHGDLNKNNFRSLAAYNPYILSRVDIRNTRYNNYYIGAKGNIQGIAYQGEFGYKTTTDLALFLSATNEPNQLDRFNRFQVLYDDVNIVFIKGTVQFDIEDFKITGILNQNFYELKSDINEKAWHLPALDLNLGIQYTTLEDKLQLKGEMYVQNGVPYRNDEGEAATLNALFDVSVGAEYFFTEKIGAFINIFNLANNKRERWHRYPTFGINALAGLSIRF